MKLSTFTAREVRNRPGRAILTVLSIVIGVAAVVSVSMATTTSRQAFRNMYQMVAGKATLIVTSPGGGYFDENIFDDVRGIDGITAAAPSIQEPANVFFEKKGGGNDNDRPEATKTQMQILGIDVAVDSQVRQFEREQGDPLTADSSGIVVDSNIAKSMNAQIGDAVSIRARGGKREYSLIGTVRPREGGAVASGGVIFLTLPEAQKQFAKKGQINFIHIVTDEHADLNQVEKALTAKLPPELKIDRAGLGSKQAEEAILPTEQGLQLGTAASFVLAVFIILNTFLMNVSERRRQLAILRAIGATRRQVIGLLLREGLLMGFVGTLLGIVLGIGGAYVLTRAMEGLFQTPLPSLIITPAPFILGPCFGMGMALIGTYFPARKAGLLSPLEGMGGTAREDSQPLHWIATALGGVVTISGGLILTGCILGYLPVTVSVMSAVALMIGMVLLVPAVLGPLSHAVYFVLRPILRTEGRLAHGQLLRRRTRTALTVGVLFIALAMGMGLGTAIVDNTQDVRHWYERTLSCDMIVRATMPSATGEADRMPLQFGEEIQKVQGVRAIEPATYLSKTKLNYEKGGKVESTSFTIISRSFSLSDHANLNLVDGDQTTVLEQMKAGQVVMSTVLAQRTGLKTGDHITLDANTKSGKQDFRIAALVNEYIASGMVVYMHDQTAKRYFNFDGVSAFLIDADHAQMATVVATLRKLCEQKDFILQTYDEITAKIDGMVSGVVGGQWLILVLSFVVAAIGMVNTLTMNVLEQTRELGLLRIVAMTRRQVRKLIFAQATMMGVLGLLPGLVVGLAVAYLMNLSMMPVLGHPVQLQWHPVMNFGCFAMGMVIVLIAAMFPAERAARIDIATALQYE